MREYRLTKYTTTRSIYEIIVKAESEGQAWILADEAEWELLTNTEATDLLELEEV